MGSPFFRSVWEGEINWDPRHFLEISFFIEVVDSLPPLRCGQPQGFVPCLMTRVLEVCFRGQTTDVKGDIRILEDLENTEVNVFGTRWEGNCPFRRHFCLFVSNFLRKKSNLNCYKIFAGMWVYSL